MKSIDRSSSPRPAVASVLAYLSFSCSPAYGHGLTPELVFLMLAALLVHVGTPIALLAMRRVDGRQGRIFGAYAAIMAVILCCDVDGGI